MHNDRPSESPTAATRAEAYRERFRRIQASRARAGGPPNEDETARLVAEFHAQGGRVTVCPATEDEPPSAGTIR